jgi:hypothetical protein
MHHLVDPVGDGSWKRTKRVAVEVNHSLGNMELVSKWGQLIATVEGGGFETRLG